MVLLQHYLNNQNIHLQGYDGVSNMRGEWKGLKALFLSDCPYAYYVQFSTWLQLALVAASKEIIIIQQFFSDLNLIVSIAGASCKHNVEFPSGSNS